MSTLRYFSMLAALSLAGAAYAQTRATPDQTDQSNTPSSQSSTGSQQTYPGTTGSSSTRAQRDVTPGGKQATEAPPTGAAPPSSAEPGAAATPHQQSSTRMAEAGRAGGVSAGMPVQTRSGEPLGTVIDIIMGPSGDAKSGYVVIATSEGSAAPVPYSAANSMVHNGKVVMDKSRLDKAPKVQQNQMQEHAGGSWQKKSDSYWGGKSSGHASSSDNSMSSEPSSDRMPPDGTGSEHNRSTNPDNPDQMPRSPQ